MPKHLAIMLLILILLMSLGLCVAIADAAASVPRPNILGVTEVMANPNTYLLAVPIEATALEGGKYYTIRFAPYNTYSLFDESVLFCGDVIPQFKGKNGVLVLTFTTRASTMFKGVGCHELISVFEVK